MSRQQKVNSKPNNMSQPRRQGDIKTLVKQEKELSSIYLRVAAQSVATLVGSTLVSFETAPYNSNWNFS
jgi:hypothetical protein